VDKVNGIKRKSKRSKKAKTPAADVEAERPQQLVLTPIRVHDLRHTYASLALQRGVPVEVVSERLGHARVDITLNFYRHLYEIERQAAALSLTDLLGFSGQPRALN
jgi:integrase